MRRSILLLTSFIIVTVNFAFADSDNAKSKPLRWNSPEIFSRWFKTTSSMSDLETLSFIDCGYQILANQVINYRYKSELLLFVDLALGDYLKTPNLSEGGKNSTVLFEHFGGDATPQLKEENVPAYIRLRLEREFKVKNLRETYSHLGGYSVGIFYSPPIFYLYS